ncbi:hypothetical protein BDR07DRAFT_1487623 [Suillus spraguei]|nr:hypothetical protein BDR07DRAFT_1487623 [Suillus spraguei]
MTVHQDDSDVETPLLQRPEQLVTKTPLPWDQFWIILVLQFSNTLVFETLAPFTPQNFIKLIRDIGVTHGDDTQVGYYVGILEAFAPDGFMRNSWYHVVVWAVKNIFRSTSQPIICGTFNGENGVVKNLLMDITDATNLPKAYGYMPISYMLAAIIGPIAGGSLSRPTDRFPEIFGRSELLKTYPYLLSCAVPVICASIACLITYFCLKESVSTRTSIVDLIQEWLPQSYAEPFTTSSNAMASYEEANSEEISPKPLPLRSSTHPAIFYATSIELGGLSLDPSRIGAILATSALFGNAFHVFFYSRLHDHFGAYAILMTGLASGIPVVILFPIINALAQAYGVGWAVWLAISIQHMLIAVLDLSYEPPLPISPQLEQPMESSSWLAEEQGLLAQHVRVLSFLIRYMMVVTRGWHITSLFQWDFSQ